MQQVTPHLEYVAALQRQAHTIQIVRAHARDLTMAAACQAYGLAPVCDWYNTKMSLIVSYHNI